MRLLVLALPYDRWPFVVSELTRVTRPGGWVESVEALADEQGGPAVDQVMGWVAASYGVSTSRMRRAWADCFKRKDSSTFSAVVLKYLLERMADALAS